MWRKSIISAMLKESLKIKDKESKVAKHFFL